MRITSGSKIISNDTSKTSYSNDPNVKGVTGKELPKSGAARTGSMVGFTAPPGSLLGFASIASIGGPGTYKPECTGEFTTHPNNMCVICHNGKWTHYDELDPCSVHREAIDPFTLLLSCVVAENIGCLMCGPCKQCNTDGDGGYSCDDIPGVDNVAECLECNNSTSNCGGNPANPYTYLCTEDAPTCCNGTCIGLGDCAYTFNGVCVPGCPPFTCSSCEFGVCYEGGACGDCQKCDTGVCVDDPDGYDSEGNPCYDASSLDMKLMP